jgi:hypothetical protein
MAFGPGPWSLNLGSWDLEFGTCILEFEIWNLGLGLGYS